MGIQNLIIIIGCIQVSSALWTCQLDSECSSLKGSVCAGGQCACPAGTQSVLGGTLCGPSCIQVSSALWTCQLDSECSSLKGSVCAGGQCACPAGTQSVLGGTLCGPIAPYYHWSPCSEDFQCSRLFTSYQCKQDGDDQGTCRCQPGSHYHLGRCWPSIDFGEPCSRDEECQTAMADPFSLSCKAGTCDCSEGYYLRQRGECRKAADLNERCVVDEDCQFTNGACDISTFLCYDSTSPSSNNTRLVTKEDDLNRLNNIDKNSTDTKMATKQNGAACDVTNSCPSPFECTMGVCVCPAGYYADENSDICYADLGSPSTPEQCIGFLAEVIDGICTCPNNFFYAENSKDCVKVSRLLTDYCDSDAACGTFGAAAWCAPPQQWGLRTCACDEERAVWDEQRKLCRYFSGVGESCTLNSDCYFNNLNMTCEVDTTGVGYCACPEGYNAAGDLCLTTGLGLGDSCTASQECTKTDHATCSGGVCTCVEDYRPLGDQCAPSIGGICSVDSDCAIENSECLTADISSTCQCQNGFVEHDDECWPVIAGPNATCQVTAQCVHWLGSDSVCQDDSCHCASGYHERDGQCWPITGMFEPCSRSSQCYLASTPERLVCRNGMCQCDFQYPYTEELGTCANSAAILKISIGLLAIAIISLIL